jgi:hypothetical protein
MEIRTPNWICLTKKNLKATPRRIADDEKNSLIDLVNNLPNILGEHDWFLSGGLVIPLRTGNF